ncbi:TetR/AcrR family transcriptional regulator [Methylocapsa sp. S129]|uniref:TetR/AcrR family transcriptional regulator n=1 Tax=Methylocapsa sp. S129 TaxID=1641869 RepID=UPI00131C0D7D|nr:TetR/AcrR family transcriptional regulator [Methylocapsa sp. S129]
MPSQKSSAPSIAREPQRDRGRLRVATLIEAAAAVFAEKGFDGATMTEIAARAATAIGSLYQFFPNKEVLADAVLARHGELLDASLGEIEARVKSLSAVALADALFDLMLERKAERAAAIVLLDARDDAAIQRAELRERMRRGIAGLLRAAAPRLSADQARTMAIALLQTLKGVSALSRELEGEKRSAALAELRDMVRLYVSNKLGG